MSVQSPEILSPGTTGGNEVCHIKTKVTANGTKLVAKQLVKKREKWTL